MVLPSEDDRDAIDRAFAELVAGYHLTADPPDPPTNEPPTEPVTANSGRRRRTELGHRSPAFRLRRNAG